jgi:molybdate transport system substrate-binding protein
MVIGRVSMSWLILRLGFMSRKLRIIWLGLLSLASLTLHAAPLQVAVASNFMGPMNAVASVFERDTGHKLQLSFGATGQFYAQIRNGAPFAILLAADKETPLKLAREGLAVEATAFTYAKGRLVLWSKRANFVDNDGAILKSESFTRLAIANPKLAPYGAAALETLTKLGLRDRIAPKIVEAANIAQSFQFAASENATLGFVAMSQVYERGKLKEGSAWLVPTSFHSPINQDAILLNPGKDQPAALALLNFLKTDKAKTMIRSFGYDL